MDNGGSRVRAVIVYLMVASTWIRVVDPAARPAAPPEVRRAGLEERHVAAAERFAGGLHLRRQARAEALGVRGRLAQGRRRHQEDLAGLLQAPRHLSGAQKLVEGASVEWFGPGAARICSP